MSILRLQHTRSDGEVDTYHLKSVRRYHIGRGSNCEVRILDLKMSRQHCAIERQGDEWLVHDLGSTNGIKLNGNRVQGSAILSPGGVIKAGNTQLEVADIDGGDQIAAAQMTPVRQEALPAEELTDERPVADRLDQDEGETFEPQSGARHPTSGALQAYGSRPPSDEFEFSDAYKALPGAEAEQDIGSAGSEPEPEPVLELAEDPIEDDPAAAVAADEAAVASRGPAVGSERIVQPAATEPASRRSSQAVKPVTIRIGTGRHQAQDSSSSLYINVMGRRIGPLSRAEAREIKARELKGTLTEEDLAKYPGA